MDNSLIQKINSNNPLDVLESFKNVDDNSRYIEHIPTGIPEFDEALEGGLTPGFTVLGAESSYGKSTLAFQITKNLLAQGKRVLIFSLEMNEKQILSKLVSMSSYELNKENSEKWIFTSNNTFSHKYMSDLKQGDHFIDYEEAVDRIKAIQTLENQFKIITPDKRQITAADIEEYVKTYMQLYPAEKPIVFVDYLQILGKSVAGESDLQKVTTDIEKLHMLAMTEDIVVFTLSSINRAGYNKNADMSSFKGSGNIEFSADTLLKIVFKDSDVQGFDMNKAKAKEERDYEIIILKQRMGKTGISVPCKFITKASYFEFGRITEDSLVTEYTEFEPVADNVVPFSTIPEDEEDTTPDVLDLFS